MEIWTPWNGYIRDERKQILTDRAVSVDSFRLRRTSPSRIFNSKNVLSVIIILHSYLYLSDRAEPDFSTFDEPEEACLVEDSLWLVVLAVSPGNR